MRMAEGEEMTARDAARRDAKSILDFVEQGKGDFLGEFELIDPELATARTWPARIRAYDIGLSTSIATIQVGGKLDGCKRPMTRDVFLKYYRKAG